MSNSDILYSSVTEIKKLLSNKEISALELTQFSLERIKETNNKTNAFLYVATDTAIEDAKNIQGILAMTRPSTQENLRAVHKGT